MATAKKAKQPVTGDTMMRIDKIEPRKNARGKITKASVSELTKSIRENGVIEPLIIRPLEGGRFQLVAGERRLTAAGYAGLKEAPVWIRNYSDEEADYVAATENLQRENLHPLDEAMEFCGLVDKAKGDVAAVARRLGKPEKFIVRRLPLADLIGAAQDDFRNGLIGIEHALELARLPQGMQLDALNACYQSIYTAEGYKPNREAPARHVSNLKNWITQHILLDLADAPFKLNDARLREDGRTCVDCPERTGTNPALFDDLASKEDTCLNRDCYNGKLNAFVQIEARRIAPKGDEKPAPVLAPYYNYTPDPDAPADLELLLREKFTPISSAKDKCVNAERGVWGAGASVGKTSWFCRKPECPDHAAAIRSSHNGGSSSGGYHTVSAVERKKKNARKQEIFDIKVAEETRRRVFPEVLKDFDEPLSLKDRQFHAIAFLERIPTEHVKVICQVMRWEYKDLLVASDKRFKKLASLIEALDESDLARFTMLMSFIHFGTSSYFNADRYAERLVKQDDVEALAAEHGVNYALIDAQVRLDLSSKKYRLAHERYLEAIKAGESATKPKVYEGALPAKAKPKKAAKVEDGASEPEETDDDLPADEYEEEE
jgi:ParB/RepB/Spo0J family partition protein